MPDEGWRRLIAAHHAYTATVSPFYDEVLRDVAQRVHASGSIGKADVGALLLWKRLRADTPWAAELMACPDTQVRAATAAAVATVRNACVSRGAAAQRGRAALAALPGFRSGDALASALLTAAAPKRMAVYDRRAHAGLGSLGIVLSHAPGRYGRYMDLIDHLLATGPDHIASWIARDVDTAPYWLTRAPTPVP